MRHLALSRSLICTSPRRACTRRSAPRLHPACTPLLHHLLLHLHYTCTTCTTCTTYVVHSRAFGAILHKTEMQLRYFPSNSSITDMSISLAGVALHVKTNTLLAPSRARLLSPPQSISPTVVATDHASG